MIIILFIAVFIAMLGYILITYNKLLKANKLVKEAFSKMDKHLKERWDLIPNLVSTVRKHEVHEQQILEELISLRRTSYIDMLENDKLKLNEQITQKISEVMEISENYPELIDDQNFIELSTNLAKIKEDIENSKKHYNEMVKALNDQIEMSPSNYVANIFSFNKAKIFEASEEEKVNIDVKL